MPLFISNFSLCKERYPTHLQTFGKALQSKWTTLSSVVLCAPDLWLLVLPSPSAVGIFPYRLFKSDLPTFWVWHLLFPLPSWFMNTLVFRFLCSVFLPANEESLEGQVIWLPVLVLTMDTFCNFSGVPMKMSWVIQVWEMGVISPSCHLGMLKSFGESCSEENLFCVA